jgi:hypothetical protein
MTSPTHAQLVVYAFAPGAEFEGRLVGALERIEAAGTVRILDLLFVRRGTGADDLEAIGLKGSVAGGLVAPLLGFRLDLAERQKATRRALSGHRPGAVPADALRAIADALAPGAALGAVLLEQRVAKETPEAPETWSEALEDAVARMGGTRIASDSVEAASLAQLAPDLVAAAGRRADAARGRPPTA